MKKSETGQDTVLSLDAITILFGRSPAWSERRFNLHTLALRAENDHPIASHRLCSPLSQQGSHRIDTKIVS